MLFAVRIMLAIASLVAGIFSVAYGTVPCSFIFTPCEKTPSTEKKAKFLHWIFFAVAVFAGCFFELWSLGEFIFNRSIWDLIIAIAYAVLLSKL